MSFYNRLVDSILKEDSNFNEILAIADKLGESDLYVAGGALRDTFLETDRPLKDVDLFVSEIGFSPFEKLLKSKGDLLVNPFGSARWYPRQGEKFYYDIIVIERFFNGLWKCDTITDVLNQFDITCNAIAVDLKSKELHNPQNGLSHLQRKELRAVRFDYPEMNISKDIPLSRNSVLWFRYNYYAKQLGFRIEEITKKWIDENSFRINDKAEFAKHFFNPDDVN